MCGGIALYITTHIELANTEPLSPRRNARLSAYGLPGTTLYSTDWHSPMLLRLLSCFSRV